MRTLLVFGAFGAGAGVAAGHFAMAVAGPPYYRDPVLLGFFFNTLTLPALFAQELYPNSWGLKYNHTAIVIANALIFGISTAVALVLRTVAVRARALASSNNALAAADPEGEDTAR